MPTDAPAPPPAPTRRRALKAGLSLVAGVAAARALYPWRAEPAELASLAGALTALTYAEARLMARLAGAMLPTEGTPLTPRTAIDVLGNIDRQVARLPAAARSDLALALKLLDFGAALPGQGGGGARLVNADDADIRAQLAHLACGSPLQRQAFGAVKQLIALGYFGDPQTFGPLRYDGPVTDPRGIARLGNAPLPLEDR